jgi:glycine dehydrogenase subunit 2
VLAANYLAARLKVRYAMPFPPPYAHEFITVPEFPGSDVTNLDIAKRLIDHGIHPPTMSFPIHDCLMIEPTETESLTTLDHFVQAMLEIADEIENNPEVVRTAPHTTPVRRLDEVTASRKPNIRWKGPNT